MTRDTIDRFDAGDTERVMKRGDIARALSKGGLNDTLVTSRETISSFGVKEWTLISMLDESKENEIEVPSNAWKAAETLAEADMVSLDRPNNTTLIARKEHDNVVVRVL